jgi:hypothetical protein
MGCSPTATRAVVEETLAHFPKVVAKNTSRHEANARHAPMRASRPVFQPAVLAARAFNE